MKKIIYNLILVAILSSCNKEKKILSTQGGIDIISNIYFEASKTLENSEHFHISKMNYNNGQMLELVPNFEFSQLTDSVYFIKNDLFYRAGSAEEAKSFIFKETEFLKNGQDVSKKDYGAIWVDKEVPDYDKRTVIEDTILYKNRTFKRFSIKSKNSYSVFYIYPTDTVLPYSLNKIIDNDYKGRLERIDTYDKEKDLFSTICLIPRKLFDNEATQIFEYNNYIESLIEKKKKE